MKCRDEKIEIVTDGKVTDTIHLNRGYPRGLVYLENEDIAVELAQGKTKKQAQKDRLIRAATVYHNAIIDAIKAIGTIDSTAADGLICDLYSTLSGAIETKAGAGVKTETLESRAATHWFAFSDALYSLMKRDMDESDLVSEACYYTQDRRDAHEIPVNARRQAYIRTLKEVRAEAAKEAAQELSPAGRAIYDRLSALEDEDPDTDEYEREQAAAEAALDALALEDPEEATRIFQRCPYFNNAIGKYRIYLGQYVSCTRLELRELDTPEKRAAYIARADSALFAEDADSTQ